MPVKQEGGLLPCKSWCQRVEQSRYLVILADVVVCLKFMWCSTSLKNVTVARNCVGPSALTAVALHNAPGYTTKVGRL